MNDFHTYALLQVYHAVGLLSFSVVLLYGIYMKKNNTPVVRSTFYTAILIFLLVAWLNIGHNARHIGVWTHEPIKSFSILMQTVVNVAATVIPPFFVYGYFQKRVPIWFKLLTAFLSGFVIGTHIQFAFEIIPFSYFMIWCQSPSYVSYALTILAAIVFYVKEDSCIKKRFFRQMIIFTAVTYPLYIFDGYSWERWYAHILWLVRPLFYVGISVLLIRLRFLIPKLFPSHDLSQHDLLKFVKQNNLTSRESDVLELVLQGCKNRDAANHLGLKEKSIENHLTKIYRKCEVASRNELMDKVVVFNQE